jgi:hypothetical protein
LHVRLWHGVFIDPSSPGGEWTETLIHTFTGGDGSYPYSTPVIGPKGVLFGTCEYGGAGVGTAYSLTPPSSPGGPWTEATIHNFGAGSDDAYPFAGLTLGPGGVLYGATAGGGTSLNWGTVYSLTTPASAGGSWTKATLYAFLGPGANDGGAPEAPPILRSGVLYGTTSGGTFYGDYSTAGTAYSLTAPTAPGGEWTESVLYHFSSESSGNSPYAPLLALPSGVLLGTAPYNFFCSGCGVSGVAFALHPPASPGGAWTETVLHTFTGGSDGGNPMGSLVPGGGSVLYGTTTSGGASGGGTAYSLTF